MSLLPLACGGGISRHPYCPHGEGSTFVFQVTILGLPMTQHITQKYMSVRQLGGYRVFPIQITSGSATSMLFAAVDSGGCYFVGEQQAGAIAPRLYPSPRYWLKYPVAVGTTWVSTHETSVLNVFERFDVEIRLTITSTSETVTVPAGTFTDCVKVVGKGQMRPKGFGDRTLVEVEVIDWLARGVGSIKTVLIESSNNLALGLGGTVTLELVSYSTQ